LLLPSSDATSIINVSPGTIPCEYGQIISIVANASKSTLLPEVILVVEKSVSVTAFTKFNAPPPAPVPVMLTVAIPPLPSTELTTNVALFPGLSPPKFVPTTTMLLPT
jgi:hypothetical protein